MNHVGGQIVNKEGTEAQLRNSETSTRETALIPKLGAYRWSAGPK
jgi:hypothetical protein